MKVSIARPHSACRANAIAPTVESKKSHLTLRLHRDACFFLSTRSATQLEVVRVDGSGWKAIASEGDVKSVPPSRGLLSASSSPCLWSRSGRPTTSHREMVGSGRRLHQWERRPRPTGCIDRAAGSEVFLVVKKYDLGGLGVLYETDGKKLLSGRRVIEVSGGRTVTFA